MSVNTIRIALQYLFIVLYSGSLEKKHKKLNKVLYEGLSTWSFPYQSFAFQLFPGLNPHLHHCVACYEDGGGDGVHIQSGVHRHI